MADETTATSAKQFFEELLPAGFAAQQAEVPANEDVTLRYKVTGDGGGEWTVRIAGGKMSVTPGASDDPALLSMTISAKDLLDALNSRNGAAPSIVLPNQQQGKGGSGMVKALKGTLVQHLTRPAGEPFELEMCFNGAATPRTELTLALADFVAMQEGKLNGQEAFMTGKMKVAGDMGFMMQVGMAIAR